MESEPVMMLSAGIFHTAILSSPSSGMCVYAQRVPEQSGKAMNDAK